MVRMLSSTPTGCFVIFSLQDSITGRLKTETEKGRERERAPLTLYACSSLLPPDQLFHQLWNFDNCQFAVMAMHPKGNYKMASKLKTNCNPLAHNNANT